MRTQTLAAPLDDRPTIVKRKLFIVSEHTIHLELVITMSFRLDITARAANYSVATV